MLDEQLKRDCFAIGELENSTLLLMNNSLFPWVVLVPKADYALVEFTDLKTETAHLVLDEIMLVSKAMQEIFNPKKMNIATLGNIVSQLHIHIIARFESDAAWPKPVWGNGSEVYNESEKDNIIFKIREKLKI